MSSINQLQAKLILLPQYKIDNKQAKVYFGRDEIPEADSQTFTVLDEKRYAKDKNHVYLGTTILTALNPAETVYLGYGRLKDNRHVYLGDKIIPDADPQTYQILAVKNSVAYAKDKNFVYFGKQKKEFIDKETIEPLNNKYAKDKNNVYFWGEPIVDSDSASFVLLSDDTGKDKNHVYYNNRIIAEADPTTFDVLNVDVKLNMYGERMQGYGYAKDKNFIYYGGEKIRGADVDSFKETTYGYATDKKRVYYFGKVVQNANPKTFIQPPYKPRMY